jgi:hypothetical protein
MLSSRLMRTSRVIVAASLVALGAGCAADPASSAQATSSPPAVAEDGARVAGEPYHLETVDKAYFQTLGEMYLASELVITGEVAGVEPGGILGATGGHPDEGGLPQMGVITVRIDEVLRGQFEGPTVMVVRESYFNERGTLRPLSLDGLVTDKVGDEVLWFLEHSAGRPAGTYEHVSLDGLLYILDGAVTTPLEGEGRLAHRLIGTPIADLLDDLAVLADQE